MKVTKLQQKLQQMKLTTILLLASWYLAWTKFIEGIIGIVTLGYCLPKFQINIISPLIQYAGKQLLKGDDDGK